MDVTRLSTKGQIVLPRSIRQLHDWGPGTTFIVEATKDGVLLRPADPFPAATIEQVSGCLKWKGKAKTIRQMNQAIGEEVRRRHDRGRY